MVPILYLLSRVRSSLSIKNDKVGNKYLLMVGTYVVLRDKKYFVLFSR
jgi:hypothetical protein